MKLATVRYGDGSSAALVENETVAPVRALRSRASALDVGDLIASPLTAGEIAELRTALEPLDPSTLLAPILAPPKILCVGKNYLEHVKEGAAAGGTAFHVPLAPVWFSKAATALAGTGAPIPFDDTFSTELDYEGELAVVIGKRARRVTREDALGSLFGYTIFNDVTARDRQQLHGQWFLGKSADGYGPCGPWIVTADEIPDPAMLEVETRVDGELRQRARVSELIFGLAELIESVSHAITLEPGDIIATGTPEGVGWRDQRFLRAGSTVSVTIAGIGSLTNAVEAVQA